MSLDAETSVTTFWTFGCFSLECGCIKTEFL